MTGQTPQNRTEPLNADYLFLIRTEHFGTVGVGVGGNGRRVHMNRVRDDGGEPGLVRLLDAKPRESQYLKASPGRVVRLDGALIPDLATYAIPNLATYIEQVYSRGVDLQKEKMFLEKTGALPSQSTGARERQETLLGLEVIVLAAFLLSCGIEAGAVEPNYLENYWKNYLNGGTGGEKYEGKLFWR